MTLLLLLALLAQADDSPALNGAIAKAAAAGGGVVGLEPRAYAIGGPLDAPGPNVTLRGVAGATRLVKTPTPSSWGILRVDRDYSGWTFEGIEFDGSTRAIRAGNVDSYFAMVLSGCDRVRFARCRFRDMGAFHLRDSRRITFDDCDFLGTKPGTVRAGVMDPPAAPEAFLTDGISVDEQVSGLHVERCRFHFCSNGLGINSRPGQTIDDVTITGCTFQGDWWDNPAPTLRFEVRSIATENGSPKLTIDAPGLKAAFAAGAVASFRRDLANGAGLAGIYAGLVTGPGDDSFKLAALGDVIEAATGQRARVAGLVSPAAVTVEGWESIDTYEPCPPPAAATAWRLSRYYATGLQAPATDTQIHLQGNPVNPYTGEQAIADAKLDLTKLPGRALAKTYYSGVFASAAARGLSVTGCTFRGSWGDQCAITLPEGARITGNRFLYGWDVGVTCNDSPGSVIAGNLFVNSGQVAVFVSKSTGTVIAGNTVQNWGLTNPFPGAISGAARGLVVTGNTFARSPSPDRDWCWYAVNLIDDSTGTLIAGNVDDGAATRSTVNVSAGAVPAKGAIVVRDARSVGGDGAVNVTAGGPEPPAPRRVQAQATIPPGKPAVTVEHGLGVQPAPEDVAIVIWGATRVWLGGVDQKTLVFRTDRPAPPAGITFTWSATARGR
jgi:hypothetical protein